MSPTSTFTSKVQQLLSNHGLTTVLLRESSSLCQLRKWFKTMNKSARHSDTARSTFLGSRSECGFFILNAPRFALTFEKWYIPGPDVCACFPRPGRPLCPRFRGPPRNGTLTELRSWHLHRLTAIAQTLFDRAQAHISSSNRALLRADAYCQNNHSCPFHSEGVGSVPKVGLSPDPRGNYIYIYKFLKRLSAPSS